ncbi:DUF7845 domain-containing protein [Haloprofundus halophilus]|uniref:DUF7845 domain-containing protein n=1 Tax=Haloprofundus halophilus TaxID=2283527 RepID=UPI000E43420E|nr:hypothetical protein [Haloprofundus halophilus]
MTHVATAPHEAEGHLIFPEHGLSPYWAVSKLLHQGFNGYSGEVNFEHDGDPWHVKLAYSDSNIAPRPSDGISRSTLYEYEIHCEGLGQKKAHFNVSPRFEEMRNPDGEILRIPWQPGGEGVDVDFHGSNLEPEEYPSLLRAAFCALADEAALMVRRDYFTEVHDSSNLYTYEQHVRLSRDMAQKLVRAGGTFYRLFFLLSSEQGTKWIFAGDNEEIVGKNHRLKLWPEAAQKLMPTNSRGKQLKCYHPKYVRSEETGDDALFHPKFGVLLKKAFNDGRAFAWGDLRELRREIEETVINVLPWAGIPTDPHSPGTYIEDDHFAPAESDIRIARYDDPSPEIEAHEEALLVTTLRELSEGAGEMVYELATDGGRHYEELADDTGYSVSTIYRYLQELGDLVRNDNGDLDLRSLKFKQEVAAIAEQTDRFVRSKADRAAKLINSETREAADSALQNWMTKWAVDLARGDDGAVDGFRIGTLVSVAKSDPLLPHISEAIKEGRRAWIRAGRDAVQYERMMFESSADGEEWFTRRVSSWIG